VKEKKKAIISTNRKRKEIDPAAIWKRQKGVFFSGKGSSEQEKKRDGEASETFLYLWDPTNVGKGKKRKRGQTGIQEGGPLSSAA